MAWCQSEHARKDRQRFSVILVILNHLNDCSVGNFQNTNYKIIRLRLLLPQDDVIYNFIIRVELIGQRGGLHEFVFNCNSK
jgi:hypothetical protein